MITKRKFILFLGIAFALILASSLEEKAKKKKDIRDYTDADLERLLEQWEADDEPLEEDELPEHLRKPPDIDLTKADMSNPESLLEMSKKGRTLMTFVTVSGSPSQHESEEITRLWQVSLQNGHIDAQRFMVDTNRAIFMFKDGSQAWKAKDYLITQERCSEVTIEGKSYPGKGAESKDKAREDL